MRFSSTVVTLRQMHRVRIFLWLAALVSCPCIANDREGSDTLFASDNFTRFEENGKVGLKDEAGQILIPALYDAIGWSNGTLSTIDKVVGYELNGLWGLIHTSNRRITTAEFDQLVPGEGAALIAQKRSPASQRSLFGIITTSGKTVIPFIYDGLTLSHLRAIVMSRSGTKFRFGLADLSHKMLIPIAYRRIYSLGSLRFAVENFEGKTAIFSDEGSALTPFAIDSISAFRKNYAVVYQDGHEGLIDRDGKFVLQPVYGSVRIAEDGTIETREADTWLLLDGNDNLLNKLSAEALTPLSEDRYAVMRGGKIRITNNRFEPIHEGVFSSAGRFADGIAIYRDRGKYGAITNQGKILIPAEYRALIPDRHLFRACIDTGYKNRWVILDRTGTVLTEKHYEQIEPFNGKFFPVRHRGYWGAVASDGHEMISCVHDSLLQQDGAHVIVKFKGAYGIIDLTENWVVTPRQNPLGLLNDALYFEYADSITFLKSFTGDIIYFSENRLEPMEGYLRETTASGGHRIINMNGMTVGQSHQGIAVDTVLTESEGFRAIRKDGKFGFIDADGRLRIANRYERVQPFRDGLAAIRIMNKWGFIDRHERLVVQPVYDRVENFRHGLAIVTHDNLSGLVDKRGQRILPLRYDQITANEYGNFILRQGALYGLADETGKVIVHPKYNAITDTGRGHVVVERDGKFGLLTLDGVSTIPMIYDALTFDPYHNQFLAVMKSRWKRFERTERN